MNRIPGRIRSGLRGALAVVILVAAFAVTWAPAAAASGGGGHASGGEHAAGAKHAAGGINWFSFDYGCWGGPDARYENPPFFFALLNFGLLVFLLVRAVRTPAREFLQARHHRVQRELDEAAKLRAQARARLDEVESRLARLDEELAEIKSAAAQEAEAERQRVIAAANEEAERIARTAERTLEADVLRIRRRLEREVVDAVIAAAEGILAERVTDADQRRLAQEYIAEIGAEEAR